MACAARPPSGAGGGRSSSAPKPTICAVDGPAVGMGAEFTSQCDLRIASTNASFAWNFVHRGLVPDTGAGTWLLPRIVGLQQALRLDLHRRADRRRRGPPPRLRPRRRRPGRPRGAHHRARRDGGRGLAAQPAADQGTGVRRADRRRSTTTCAGTPRRSPSASPATTTARAWPRSSSAARRCSPAPDRGRTRASGRAHYVVTRRTRPRGGDTWRSICRARAATPTAIRGSSTAWLRANDPVHWHPEADGPGFWAITKYDDIRMISRQPKLFSSYARGVMMAETDDDGLFAQRQMMLTMDPPQHDRFKLLVSRGFTPRNAQALAGRVADLSREIVDDVIERGECDLVHDVTGRLPSGSDRRADGHAPRRRRAALRAHRDHAHHRRRRRPAGGQDGCDGRDARVRPAAGRAQARRAGRRHRHDPGQRRGRRRPADRRRVPVVLPAAGQRRRRHHAQPARRRHPDAVRPPRPARPADGRPRRADARRRSRRCCATPRRWSTSAARRWRTR